MSDDQLALKKLAKISLAAIGALFVLGIIFYKERISFADAAFVLFNITNYNDFAIQCGRYGSFITQLFPYVGQKLHLPVNALMFLYGMSFNLFYFTVASLLVYWCKQYRLAILMALFYFLFFSQSYIWISEIPQGVAWMFLFFGVTLHLGNKQVNIFLLLLPFILFAFLALYSHFVIIIPTLFLWAYLIVEKKNWPFSLKTSILLSCVLVAVFGAKFAIAIIFAPPSGGDAPLLQGVTKANLADAMHSFNTPVISMFFLRCVTNYWIGTIIFFAGIVNLVKNRQIILPILTLLTCTGYIIIMGLTYGNFDKNFLLFHVESEWVCIGIIAATPFVFSFLPGTRFTLAPPWLLAGIFLIRLTYIVIYIPAFTTRTHIKEQIEAQMRKKGITKLALYNDEGLRAKMILDWALPYESVLMSSMNGDKPQLTFLFVNPDDKHTLEQLKYPKGFYNVWSVIPCNDLNKKYYNIDSTQAYKIMTYEEFLK